MDSAAGRGENAGGQGLPGDDETEKLSGREEKVEMTRERHARFMKVCERVCV